MSAQTSYTTHPHVAVLMPVYNACGYIDLAIESILIQSYPYFELIVLDDGSTDDSFKRAQFWAASDKRVRSLRNDKNRGVVYTRNQLFREASTQTKYFAMMDSDDISLPNRLAHQVEFLEANPEYGLVGGHNLIIDSKGNTIGVRRYPLLHEEILSVLTRFSPFSHPTVMLRRNVIETVGHYDALFPCCEDYDLWMRIALNYRVANLDEITLKYRISQNQIKQKQLSQTIRNTLKIQKKWLFDPRLRSIKNISNWCAMHILLLLPEYFVLTLFKKIAYSKKNSRQVLMMINFAKLLYSHLFEAADRLNRRNILEAVTTYGLTVRSRDILDIGCDDGRWTEKLVAAAAEGNSAPQIIRVVGIEIFEKQALLAEKKGIQVYRADVSNGLPCESASFDIVHANQVIEHLPQIDIFVAEVLRVLKPNGLMIISSENASAWHNIFAAVMGWQIFSLTNVSDRAGALGNPLALHRGEDAFASSWTHKTIFNYRGFKELFEVHGFQDVTVMGAGYHPLPPIFGKLDPRHAHFITAIGRKPISSTHKNEIINSKIEKISGYIEQDFKS